MNWIKVFSIFREYPAQPIKIDHQFSSSLLIVRADTLGKPDSWHRAGWMVPIFDADPIQGQVEGISRRIYLTKKAMRFEALGLPFQLEFRALGWITNIVLEVWEPQEATDVESQLLQIEKKVDELTRNQRKTLTFTLSSVQYLPHPEEASLIISKFTIPINHETYEVGRFSRIDSDEIISDPILDANPNLLIARFTSEQRVEPGTISVKIVVQEQ